MDRRVVAIAGPTGVGKTGLAAGVAASIGGEVVNVDSRQVYRGMDVGTGKPPASVRSRAPHHLFDIVDPDAEFTLARYLDEARAAIEAIHGRGAAAVLVGGTGQYFWALIEGWAVPRVPPDRAFRDRLLREASEAGASSLHDRLARVDPGAARSIDPNNVRRTVRALEVIESTGRPFSDQRVARAPDWDLSIVGVTRDRAGLDDRIRSRIVHQLDEGWVDEVRTLLAHGYSTDLPAFGSLGYREVAGLVRGERTRDETFDRVFTATRRFSRRQYAWFKPADPRISWIDAGTARDPLQDALALISFPSPP